MERTSPGKKIKQLRMDAGMTQKQLAALLGKSESAVRMWELDRNEPDITALLLMSKIFECSIDFLLGNQVPAGDGYSRPGIPYFSKYNVLTQEAEGTIHLSKNAMKNSSQYFGLTVPDSAMSPLFQPGELVIIQPQDACFNGQHAAVMVSGEDAVIRRLRFQGDGILLQPENAQYPAAFYSANDIDDLPVTVLGIAVCSVKEVSY